MWPYQLSLLCIDGVTELQQSLELVVLGEGYDLHHGPKFTEDLEEAKNSGKCTQKHDQANLSSIYLTILFLDVFCFDARRK